MVTKLPENIFDMLQQFDSDLSLAFNRLGSNNYPVLDYYKKNEDGKETYHIELAVTGIPKENIHISEVNNILKISSDYENKENSDNVEYFMQRIAKRKFNIQLPMPTGYMIDKESVTLKDGILSINLEPNGESVKKIEIK